MCCARLARVLTATCLPLQIVEPEPGAGAEAPPVESDAESLLSTDPEESDGMPDDLEVPEMRKVDTEQLEEVKRRARELGDITVVMKNLGFANPVAFQPTSLRPVQFQWERRDGNEYDEPMSEEEEEAGPPQRTDLASLYVVDSDAHHNWPPMMLTCVVAGQPPCCEPCRRPRPAQG